MKVAMVKHTPKGQVFWFKVPEHLTESVKPGIRVSCETRYGSRFGVAVSTALEASDVKNIMTASGATGPLRSITGVPQCIFLTNIKIPDYMARSTPFDEKIAKRFMEFYRTGEFQTRIVVDKNCNLLDGYTAYLVAKKMGIGTLSAIVKEE